MSRSERAQNLVRYATEELERFRIGEIESVSSLGELASRFDYNLRRGSTGNINRILQRAGLHEERKNIPRRGIHGKKESYFDSPIPSSDFAWVIGVLAGGGFVNGRDRHISVESGDSQFLEEFKVTAERVFRQEASYRVKDTQEGNQVIKGIIFSSSSLAIAIGDLRNTHWNSTIAEKHEWILKEHRYSWSFLSGFFDRVGNVYSSSGNRKIVFYMEDLYSANLLADLLTKLGVEKIHYESKKNARHGIQGISVTNIRDIQLIAANIHSRVLKKEKQLEVCRNLKIVSEALDLEQESDFSHTSTRESVVEAYSMVRTICLREKGRLPTKKDILNLGKKGIAQDIVSIFGHGNFSKAREELEKLLIMREHNDDTVER